MKDQAEMKVENNVNCFQLLFSVWTFMFNKK
jgi:hypothetical protein